MADRTEELAAGLAAVRARIAKACEDAGRAPGEVTLVAVTKTYPAEDVVRLAGLGVTEVGENRDQEAAAKAAAVRSAGAGVRWHFVGHLQRNKCRSVAGYAGVVHSVDSVRLATALGDAAAKEGAGHPIEVLIQVSVDGDPARGGAAAGTPEIDRIAETVAASEGLALRGVMTVAPMDWEPEAAFAALRDVSERLRVEYPAATLISAGMSGDLEMAVKYGSTHVRVGTALLGNRPPLR
jgi:pyridoxal phosphate enzyme (YggS family)